MVPRTINDPVVILLGASLEIARDTNSAHSAPCRRLDYSGLLLVWSNKADRFLLDNLVMFLKIVSGAQQLYVPSEERRSSFRIWQIMVEVEVVATSALHALATVSFPNFQFDGGWN